MELTMQCPVCKEVQLVMSERQNIEIDYCPQCRGVWLDRGELDKIIERSQHEESSFLAQNNSFATQGLSPNVPQSPPPPPQQPYGVYGETSFGHGGGPGGGHHQDDRGHGSGYNSHNNASFLKRLFD
jgi:Zn-finger nucleic acid-binding protein